MKTGVKVIIGLAAIGAGIFGYTQYKKAKQQNDEVLPELEDDTPVNLVSRTAGKIIAPKPAVDTFKDKVKYLQSVLNLVQDGAIGPKTKAAVLAVGYKEITTANIDQVISAAVKKMGKGLKPTDQLAKIAENLAALLYRNKDKKVQVMAKGGAISMQPDIMGKTIQLRAAIDAIKKSGGTGKDISLAYYKLYNRNLTADMKEGFNISTISQALVMDPLLNQLSGPTQFSTNLSSFI